MDYFDVVSDAIVERDVDIMLDVLWETEQDLAKSFGQLFSSLDEEYDVLKKVNILRNWARDPENLSSILYFFTSIKMICKIRAYTQDLYMQVTSVDDINSVFEFICD